MPYVKKYSLSQQKVRHLYAAVDAPIMKARIALQKLPVTKGVSDSIYEIMFTLQQEAPQSALDCFIKSSTSKQIN